MPARDELCEALIARLTAGEAVDAAAIPPALRDDPAVARLLSLARVLGALAHGEHAPPPVAEAAPVSAPDRIGPYRLVRSLGRGGMGEVWLGERADGTVDQRVAIKRVRVDLPGFHERLRGEWRILARLDHPNIARFVDAGSDEQGQPWLALEYVEGRSITEWCREQRLGLEQRLRLLLKVCAAVEHAHRHLVVHRDLKPNNVLVTAQGEPKLLDFGIAKLLDGSGGEQTTGALTPAYAAPEQLRGAPVSTSTDVYSLGLLMFRVLAGARPRTRSADAPLALLARLDAEERERPSDRIGAADQPPPYPAAALRGDLDAVVAQAIRAEPEARYASVRALADDIERFLDSHPVRARQAGVGYRLARFARRHRAALALALLAVAALVGGTLVSLWQSWRAEREAQLARAELQRAERLSQFLASLFREHDPMHRDLASARPAAAVLAEAAARVERELGDDPLAQAKLLRVLAEGQLNLGELQAAGATVERAAAALAAGAAQPLLQAEVDTLRGRLALKQLDNAGAERWFQAAVDAATAARGAGSVEAARVEAERALGLVVAGKFKEARASAETAQRVLLEQRGPDDAETMQSRYVLGVIQEQLRDDEAAVASLRTATAGFETLYGADDARLVGTLQSLGEVLRRRGEIDAARGALDRAIAIGRLRYGQRHPLVAMALTKLAAIEITAARSEVAVRVLDEAEQAVVEGDLSARAQVLATRGRVRLELEEDGARAEPDLREALRLRRASADGRNPIEWFTQAELGVAVALQGRHAEAEQLLLEAQRELLAQLGPGAYQNALLAHRLSRAYALAGRWPASADAMRDTIQITEKNYGDDHVLSFHYRLILVDRLSHVAAARAEAVALADALEARWAGRPEVEDGLAELALHRARLRLAGGDAAGARAIARAAVAAGDRPADDDVRRQLQAIAGG